MIDQTKAFRRALAAYQESPLFDGIGPDSIQRHVELISFMKKSGHLNRVLISQDAGWYWVGEPGGGKFRPYATLFEQFLPALAKAGFSKDEIRTLTVKNPAEAYTVRVRELPRSGNCE